MEQTYVWAMVFYNCTLPMQHDEPQLGTFLVEVLQVQSTHDGLFEHF